MKIKSISEQVKDHVLDLIKFGELNYGDKIDEMKLAEDLGISRTPVREAMIQMTSSNILENKPRKGYYVVNLSEKDILDIWYLIGLLDSYCMELVFPSIGPRALEDLHEAIDKSDQAIEDRDYKAFYLWQEKFHSTYRELCDNNVLKETIENMFHRILRATFYDSDPYVLFSVLKFYNDQHKTIVRLIEAGDAASTKAMVYRHWTEPEPVEKFRAESAKINGQAAQ